MKGKVNTGRKASLCLALQTYMSSAKTGWLLRQCFWSAVAYRAFSHDVMAAIFVFQNNETAGILVYQISPEGVELFSYANTSICSNKFACVLAT